MDNEVTGALCMGLIIGAVVTALILATVISTESGISTFYRKVHNHQIVLDNDGFYKTYSAVRVHGK